MTFLGIYSVIMTIAFIRMWIKRDYMHKIIGDFTYMLHSEKIMDKRDQQNWFYSHGHTGFTWRTPIWERE